MTKKTIVIIMGLFSFLSGCKNNAGKAQQTTQPENIELENTTFRLDQAESWSDDKKTLLDFQVDWEKLVDKAISDYNSLSIEERIWFNIECLIAAVDNGGLVSHYYNSGADHNKETIIDLATLGFQDIADLLLQINKLFPNNEPSINIDERNDVISSWTDSSELDNWFEQLDTQFYNKEGELEQALVKLIETRIVKKVSEK